MSSNAIVRSNGSHAADARVRQDRFTTRIKQPRDQLEYWRQTVAPLMDVETSRLPSEGFYAQARGYDLGRMHLACVRVDAMKYSRNAHRVAKSNIDHWQLVLRRRGSDFGTWGGRPLRCETGSIDIRSLAVPNAGSATAGEMICIWMSRDNFSTIAHLLDAACHRPITGAMKIVLREFILALERYRSSLSVQEAPFIVAALTSLIDATIRPTEDRLAEAAAPISASLFEAARRYIDLNLGSSSLGAEVLCRELSVSRRKLYYLFEHCGGLATYIKTRRLERCREALESATDHRLISTVAYRYGFSDPALFSRAFRAHFGYSPKEVRQARTLMAVPQANPPTSFAQWLRVGKS